MIIKASPLTLLRTCLINSRLLGRDGGMEGAERLYGHNAGWQRRVEERFTLFYLSLLIVLAFQSCKVLVAHPACPVSGAVALRSVLVSDLLWSYIYSETLEDQLRG